VQSLQQLVILVVGGSALMYVGAIVLVLGIVMLAMGEGIAWCGRIAISYG